MFCNCEQNKLLYAEPVITGSNRSSPSGQSDKCNGLRVGQGLYEDGIQDNYVRFLCTHMYYHRLIHIYILFFLLLCGLYCAVTSYNYLINNSYILYSVTGSIRNRYRFKGNRMKILFVEV